MDKKDNDFLRVAMEIDRIASKDRYFTSRQLKANADLYGSFVYMALYASPILFCFIATTNHPLPIEAFQRR